MQEHVLTDESQREAFISRGFDCELADEVLARVGWRQKRIAAGDTELEALVAATLEAARAIQEPIEDILTMTGDDALLARQKLSKSEAYIHYQRCWKALDDYEMLFRDSSLSS